MMIDRDLATLLDVDHAARRVLDFVRDIEHAEALEADSKTLDAVLYRINAT
jgi:hypothetical protein